MTPSASPFVEHKIIQAAIDCIEKYGVQGVTSRKIAEKAGLSGASINYYFRTKDVLIDICMNETLDNAFDFGDFEELPGESAHARCVAIFDELIAGGLNYPGLTRSHFYELLTAGKYDSLVVKKLNEFVQNLAGDMQARGAALDLPELQLACAQMTMTVMMAILAPALFSTGIGLDIQDTATRQRFVEQLVGRFF
ncbi:MAG: TetR/AcrR family transcriptional regulator [Anaerolineaceae bacterium]|nr:TetR/AcrR family transcriptional regulator [Anaerolineaceae bacterium]